MEGTLNPVASNTPQETDNNVVDVAALEHGVESHPSVYRPLTDRFPEEELSKILSRPRLIYELNSDFTGFTASPFATWKLIPQVANILNNYRYFRGNLRLIFTHMGGASYMGRALFACYPHYETHSKSTIGKFRPLGTSVINKNVAMTMSQLPSIWCDYCTSTTQELKLPWPLPSQFLDIQASVDNEDWILAGVITNDTQLAQGSTPDVFKIQVYAYYEEVELAVINPQGPPKSLEAPPVTLSRAMSTAADLMASIPGPFMTPGAALMKFGSSVAESMGYSKLNSNIPNQALMRFTGNCAAMNGEQDFTYTLGVSNDVYRNGDPSLLPLSDNCTDKSPVTIAQRTSICQLDWAPGATIAVTPGAHKDFASNTHRLTPLAFVSAMFEFWSGSIGYCLDVVSSPLVRVRLGIMIVPPGVATPVAFDGSGNYITHVVECVGSTCFDFEVPYMYFYPFKKNELIINTDASTNNTRIVYFLLGDPTTAGTTPVIPEVNLWVHGGKTISFSTPCLDQIKDYTTYQLVEDTGYVPQGKGFGVLSHSLVGEKVDSLEDLAKRVCIAGEWQNVNELDPYGFWVPVVPMVPVWDAAAGARAGPISEPQTYIGWCFLNWISLAFTANVGSVVHKILCKGSSQVVCTITTQFWLGPLDVQRSTSMGGMAFDTSNNPFVEVRCVDRNSMVWKPPASGCTSANQASIFVYSLSAHRVFQNNDNVFDWVGAGDDFRLGGFLCAPVLRLL